MNTQEGGKKEEKNSNDMAAVFLPCYFAAGKLPVQHVVLLASGKFQPINYKALI